MFSIGRAQSLVALLTVWLLSAPAGAVGGKPSATMQTFLFDRTLLWQILPSGVGTSVLIRHKDGRLSLILLAECSFVRNLLLRAL